MPIPTNDAEVRELMFQNLVELEPMAAKAIGLLTVMVMEDGDIRYFSVYALGGKFPLLAGAALGQHKLLHSVEDHIL